MSAKTVVVTEDVMSLHSSFVKSGPVDLVSTFFIRGSFLLRAIELACAH